MQEGNVEGVALNRIRDAARCFNHLRLGQLSLLMLVSSASLF
jgi:hypothetical protein